MKVGNHSLLIGKLFADVISIACAWLLAGFLRFFVIPGGQQDDFGRFAQFVILTVVYTIFFISRNGLYEEDLEHSWRKQTTKLFISIFEGFLLLVVTLFFLFPQKLSRLSIGMHFIFLVVFLVFERTLISSAIQKAYQKGIISRRILLVGFGDNLEKYEKALHSKRVQGVKLIGQFDGQGKKIGGALQIKEGTLREVVEQTKPDLVVIGYPPTEYPRQQKIVAQALDLLNEKVQLLPTLPQSYISTKISDFRWVPVLTLNAAEIGVFGRIMKRLFDVVSCSLAVTILSPVLLLIAFIIKVTSPGPVIFKQKRITKGEEVFTMYKFRSMRNDIPEGDVHWTEENDPRVTKIGKLLRKTSLDELPQLFNVIGGSMSLIGPRPERPELVEKFNSEIPGYRMRHRVRAGISGWAQVNGWRGNTSLERRIEFDLFYIRNWTLLFDLRIVIFTIFKGFVNENAY